MNNKVMGLVLIVFGIILFLWGYDVYRSQEIEASSVIPPLRAWVGMVVGAINVFVGVLKLKSKA
ncbi:DUF3185 family protein [Psychromonas sp. L1A2]|uniref:DUF3185 family protein n=1 Tax=Psychromonas sp. L1A2 TaxID=2686356 RepID=UPI00135AFE8A|nr:DUF3185 family protein [Psychromonas sp. L1A2]